MYTLESHVKHIAEAKALEPLYVTTQMLELDAKRVRLLPLACIAAATRRWSPPPSRCMFTWTPGRHAAPMTTAVRREARSDSRAAHAGLPAPPEARPERSPPGGAASAMPKIVDHEQRRDEIALVACRVVAECGFEQATIARIARAAGYTTGMVAHYFDTKQDIIIAALRLMLRRIDERLLRNSEGERPELLASAHGDAARRRGALHRVRVLDRILGAGHRRQAPEARQRLGAPRVPAPLRALPLAAPGRNGRSWPAEARDRRAALGR